MYRILNILKLLWHEIELIARSMRITGREVRPICFSTSQLNLSLATFQRQMQPQLLNGRRNQSPPKIPDTFLRLSAKMRVKLPLGEKVSDGEVWGATCRSSGISRRNSDPQNTPSFPPDRATLPASLSFASH